MGSARAKRQNIVMLLKRQRGPVPTAKSGDWRGFGEDLDPLWPVASENSILVQAAKDWMGNNVSDPFDQARAGGVLPERNMGPHLIIIGGVFHKDPKRRPVSCS